MNRELALDTMMLLSAMESTLYSKPERIPDHLWDQLSSVQDRLRQIVLSRLPQTDIEMSVTSRGIKLEKGMF